MDQSATDVATVPVYTVVSTRIIVPWRARIFAVLKMLIAFFFALGALGLATRDAELVSDSFSLAIYVEMLIAAVLFPLAALSGWSNMRSAFARKARLEVLPDRLAIYHGGVFRAPTAIARDDIAATAFDHRPRGRFKRRKERDRFELNTGGDEGPPEVAPGEPRWLYSSVGGAPLPLLGQVADVPNVAVLFTEPKRLRPIRRWQKAFPSKILIGPPLHKRNSRGFLANVKDPETLRDALDGWGIVRPITRGDLAANAPPPVDAKRVRRLRWRDNAILFAIVAGQAIIPLVVAAQT
ncbi:MAG: hypothetical protein ACRDLB_08010 [Actinomycetota bacterium]